MIIRPIKNEELLEARRVSSVAFNWGLDDQGQEPADFAAAAKAQPKTRMEADPSNIWAAFTEEGEMTSVMGVAPYQVYFDGNKVPMGGIAEVGTLPMYRRTGGIRAIFGQVLPHLYEQKVPLSFLYPFSEAFYRKFGYERSAQNRQWLLDLKALPEFDYTPYGEIKMCRTPEDQEQAKEAYELFASRHNMCISREKFDWGAFAGTDPFKNTKYLYSFVTKEGKCTGYIVFQVIWENGVRVMDTPELVFADITALRALLELARRFNGSYAFMRVKLPDTVNLDFFITDYAKTGSKVEAMRQLGMARVTNVPEVLRLARYQGSGSLSIQITDNMIEAQNRVYTIEYADGKAVNVTEQEIGSIKADVEMGIGLFSSAMMGALTVAEMEYRPEIVWNCAPEKAAGVFFKKSNWLNNFF